MDKDRLAALIHGAFGEVRHPGYLFAVDEREIDFFDDFLEYPRWQDIPSNVLEKMNTRDALDFSDFHSFCYFLPALMTHSLKDEYSTDPLISLNYQYHSDYFDLLSELQQSAIIQFIRFKILSNWKSCAEKAKETLSTYPA